MTPKTYKEGIQEMSNKLNIWLDDERNPADDLIQGEFGAKPNQVWIKHPDELKDDLLNNRIGFIDFDHDLGFISSDWIPHGHGGVTGYDLSKMIASLAIQGKIERIEWKVHSMNSVGRQNIISAMKNAEKFWEEQGK